MWRRSLTGLDHRQLRLWLLLFFLALAIPTAVLLRQTYSQLKWEAVHQHRLLAEELAQRIDRHIGSLVGREETRAFNDYAFLTLVGDPGSGYAQPSPLSAYPVASDIPGLIGYFQVDNDGGFSSPLLPAATSTATRYGISAQELQQRQTQVALLQDILSQNRLVRAGKGASGSAEAETGGSQPRRRDRESDAPGSLAERAAPEITGTDRMGTDPLAGQAMFDQLNAPSPVRQKTRTQQAPGKLGRIEDLQLDERFETTIGGAAQEALEKRAAPRESRSARKEYSALPEAKTTVNDSASMRIRTFESDIDPFEFSLLDSGHFVLFRKVWRNGQRYIQGMVIEPQTLLRGTIETLFRDTALSRMSDMVVAYRGDVFDVFSSQSQRGYLSSAEQLSGSLLYRSHLSAPLGDLELLFSIQRLPAPPGATLVNWLAAILALVLCAGFYLMYRLGSRQIALARQQQDFVSAVSHELKTPLTSIRMYGEMLREGWAPEEKKKSYYDFIHDESERLSRLISNVLQLARMTRNELQITCKTVPVPELMDGVRSRVASQVERAGFELSISVDAEAASSSLEVDSDGVIQILINLVDNAIKFSAQAERKAIDIRCSRLANKQLQFTVRDYGPGVPRDQMKKIFHLFYRSGNELTRETVGTGIGLALVRQLVSAMHGTVDVVNRQPGAEFRIAFPAAVSDRSG